MLWNRVTGYKVKIEIFETKKELLNFWFNSGQFIAVTIYKFGMRRIIFIEIRYGENSYEKRDMFMNHYKHWQVGEQLILFPRGYCTNFKGNNETMFLKCIFDIN